MGEYHLKVWQAIAYACQDETQKLNAGIIVHPGPTFWQPRMDADPVNRWLRETMIGIRRKTAPDS
ncbi:hypothetical protein [Sphingomonas glacialis]|uniref:hypothetical protein n=1 Tax=Sphingomonas glacialis TaxID=658225 RepID=UPI00138671E4|nr:hypothetical protein [Sphingomonas glacialis]